MLKARHGFIDVGTRKKVMKSGPHTRAGLWWSFDSITCFKIRVVFRFCSSDLSSLTKSTNGFDMLRPQTFCSQWRLRRCQGAQRVARRRPNGGWKNMATCHNLSPYVTVCHRMFVLVCVRPEQTPKLLSRWSVFTHSSFAWWWNVQA